jgi:hypothetical protein
MKKSFTSTLILLGCLVAAMAWYFGYEKRLRPEEEKAEEKTKELITLDRNLIQEITIAKLTNPPADGAAAPATPEYQTILLKKSGSDWNLVKPIEYPADLSTLDSMLTTLTTTKYDRIVDEKPKDLDEYGLKTPLLKITIARDSTLPPQEIWVGRDTPTGSSCYAKTGASEKVYRVSRVLHSSFDKTLTALRTKTILDIPRLQVAEVEIQLPKESIVVKKNDHDENWTLLREGLPADPTEWNKTLAAIMDTKAQDFVDGATDLKKYGLKPPTAKVVITKTNNGGKVTLWLGTSKDGSYSKREDKDTIYTIDKDALVKIQRPSSVYVDKHVASFNRFDTTRIKLTHGSDTVEVVKGDKDQTWSFTGDAKTPVDKQKVDVFLTGLQDLKVSKYLKGASSIKNPALVLQVFEKQDKQDAPKLTLTFAEPRGKEVTGEKAGVGIPFEINEADWKKINLGKSDLAQQEKKNSDGKPTAQAPGKSKS